MVLFHALLYKEKIMVEYKKFKTREAYKGLNMIGETVEIPRGTDVECRRGHIYYDGAPVCYYTSQIARDYFVWNDNDDFNARAVLLNTILFNNDMKVWTEEVDVLSQTGEVIDKVFTTWYNKVVTNNKIDFSQDSKTDYLLDFNSLNEGNQLHLDIYEDALDSVYMQSLINKESCFSQAR